jgi:hypothetical protein
MLVKTSGTFKGEYTSHEQADDCLKYKDIEIFKV